jgi:hypothetical protein
VKGKFSMEAQLKEVRMRTIMEMKKEERTMKSVRTASSIFLPHYDPNLTEYIQVKTI